MKNAGKASMIAFNAYQMFSGKPNDMQTEPFEMYSFDRPSNIFWSGVAEYMLDKGKTESEVREWLTSKNARWMLDHYDDQLYELGKSMAEKYMAESND